MNDTINTQNNETITLWGLGISPYVRKIVAALEEKSLAYDLVETLPKSLLQATNQPIAENFDQASPLGKIPALKVGNFTLADSAVIAAFLDNQYTTGSKLYPNEAKARAKALWFEKYADTVLSAVSYSKIFVERVVKPNVLGVDINENKVGLAINTELPALLDYLNNAVEQNTWFAGSVFSMADIAVTTQLLALQMAGFELSQSNKWPALAKHMEKVTQRQSFAKIMA